MSACIDCGPAPSLSDLRGSDLRAAWEDHPHYPEQLLLVGSHDNFRRLSQILIARARERAPGWRVQVLLLFRWWHQGMRGHEGYEEHKLYPYLSRRYAVSMQALADDHEALHVARDRVIEALLEAERKNRDELDDEALVALEAYDRLLDEHLDREEATVIPLLLDLSPEEFRRYTALPIQALLAELPEASCAANDSEAPSPHGP